MNKKELIEKLKKYDFIFVTGITGTGKTTFAIDISNDIDKEFYPFDMNWEYGIEISKTFINKLSNKSDLIIDGIPFGDNNFYDDFIEFSKGKNIGIVCLYFDDFKYWFKNILSKKYYSNSHHDVNYFYKSWEIFYLRALKELTNNIKDIYFYNVNSNEISSNYSKTEKDLNNLSREINRYKGKNILEIYLNMLNEEDDYDALYQDVEIINKIGYSKSYLTWDAIKDITDYKDKIIVDMGCFHGYFSFKVLNEGAKFVYGLDISTRVLNFCDILKNVYNKDNIGFFEWNESCELPKDYDIILVLNVLHHFNNPDTFLNNIEKGTEVIFEVEKKQQVLIEKYFEIVKTISSHRVDDSQNRIIIKAIRSKNV